MSARPQFLPVLLTTVCQDGFPPEVRVAGGFARVPSVLKPRCLISLKFRKNHPKNRVQRTEGGRGRRRLGGVQSGAVRGFNPRIMVYLLIIIRIVDFPGCVVFHAASPVRSPL